MPTITRGIPYYSMMDVENNLYRTAQAKRLEDVIVFDNFNLEETEYVRDTIMVKKTAHLNFFIGDIIAVFVPEETIRKYFKAQVLKKELENPLISDPETQAEYDELMDFLMDDVGYKDPNKYLESAYAVIYKADDKGSRQLLTVASAHLPKLDEFFSDSRKYLLDDGTVYFSEDGMPDDVYYYYKDDKCYYTKDIDKGVPIGA